MLHVTLHTTKTLHVAHKLHSIHCTKTLLNTQLVCVWYFSSHQERERDHWPQVVGKQGGGGDGNHPRCNQRRVSNLHPTPFLDSIIIVRWRVVAQYIYPVAAAATRANHWCRLINWRISCYPQQQQSPNPFPWSWRWWRLWPYMVLITNVIFMIMINDDTVLSADPLKSLWYPKVSRSSSHNLNY